MLLLTLNVIIETGQKCRLICNTTTKQIHHKLYELLAAMIRGSRKNCSVFATEKWLKVFIDQLSMPQFTHDVLEVIQCLLADSPEVLNIITKDHIQVGSKVYYVAVASAVSSTDHSCTLPCIPGFLTQPAGLP